jgi:signal transduction histidine kinase
VGLVSRIRPPFWDETADGRAESLNYRRLWKVTFGGAVAVALLPLVFLSLINFYQFEQQYQLQRGEIVGQVERLLSNTRLQLTDFLKERQSALVYVVQDNSFAQLADHRRLSRIFLNLRRSFGGFVDLGLIDSQGLHRAYVGPYALEGHNYKDEDWFKEVVVRGLHVSEVFLGHRNVPHFVVAVKHDQEDGGFHVLRATINTARIQDMLAGMSLRPASDAFLVNQSGVLQTPSRLYGLVLETCPLPLPRESGEIEVGTAQGLGGQLIAGFARVQGTPFSLVLLKQPEVLLEKWSLLRINMLLLVVASALAILAVTFKGTSSLVNRLYQADLRRAAVLHEIEYTNKLASIGRLAAGVAHEINNPIAIINEKAGLMRDLITARDESPLKEKYLKSLESILGSVKRVSAVTHRLLGFARHLDVKLESIHLELLLQEVLDFLGKEAQYRNVSITVTIPPDIPPIESDRGQLQQVFLNIIHNALNAVSEGGQINISVARRGPDKVAVSIADDGVGIPREHVQRIFEPFFSTRTDKGGTGLGLSITYGIVRKLGGDIEVESALGEGTTFTVTLPLARPE